MEMPTSLTLPCPVGGDTLIFCRNVSDVAKRLTLPKLRDSSPNEVPYAVFDAGNDAMTIVVESDVAKTRRFKLLDPKTGFDSTLIWSLQDEEAPERAFLLFLQLPVSGRTPIPEMYRSLFVQPDLTASMSLTQLWVYDITDRCTISDWRAKRGRPDPDEVYEIASMLSSTLIRLHRNKHCVLRFNAETVVLGEGASFLGVTSLDLPWNESCAQANGALAFDVCVPPECRDFLKRPLAVSGDVFIFGVVLYYLIAGKYPPICEALDFECPLGPRIFEPGFPLGLDSVIMHAILPSPMRRYATIEETMADMAARYEAMIARRDCTLPLRYDAAVDTYIGINKRLRCPVNQDAVLLRTSCDGQRIMIVVADGVSTSKYGSGDIASGILAKCADEYWNASLANAENIDAKAAIQAILLRCNKEICSYIRRLYANEHPTASESMGTTALIGFIDNGHFTLGSVGDSRAYLIRDNSISCITRDHNLFTMAVVNGMPIQQCAVHPHAGSLVQCLGFFEDIEDSRPGPIDFDTYSINLMPGDHILMTTDGLIDYAAQDVRDAEAVIARTILSVADPALACLELILVANRGGGGDNTGIGLVYVYDACIMTPFKP